MPCNRPTLGGTKPLDPCQSWPFCHMQKNGKANKLSANPFGLGSQIETGAWQARQEEAETAAPRVRLCGGEANLADSQPLFGARWCPALPEGGSLFLEVWGQATGQLSLKIENAGGQGFSFLAADGQPGGQYAFCARLVLHYSPAAPPATQLYVYGPLHCWQTDTADPAGTPMVTTFFAEQTLQTQPINLWLSPWQVVFSAKSGQVSGCLHI